MATEAKNGLERLFLNEISKAGLPTPQLTRTNHGELCCTWKSPCSAIGDFNAYINDFPEIMLSCKITHTHCEYFPEAKAETSNESKNKIVVAKATKKTSLFLNDKVVVSEHLKNGQVHSQSWSAQPLTKKELAQQEELGIKVKSYMWSGEHVPTE